jgi:hypothetical protein
MGTLGNVYRQTCVWGTVPICLTVLLVVAAVSLSLFKEAWAIVVLRAIALVVILCGLYFCPKYIAVTPSQLVIGRLLTKRTIALNQIASVVPYQRAESFIRTCGSGGVCGYWGWFRNNEVGNVFVYATRMDQLLLVTLSSGRKYVLSCKDAKTMADNILLHLGR